MSVEAQVRVFKSSKSTGTARLIVLYFANSGAVDDNWLYMGGSGIRAWCNATPEQITKAVARLIRMGGLEERVGEAGYQYRLTF